MSRGCRCALLVLMVLWLTACSAGLGDGRSQTRSTDGPLILPGSHTWWRESRAGDVFSDGFEILLMTGKEPLVIEEVRSVGDEDVMEPLGVRLAMPGRPYDFYQNMRGFPPRAMAQFQRPAIGATLQPDKSYMLILGYRVRSGEMGRRTAIVIDYRSDGIRYTARFPAGLVICPAGLTDTACSFKYPAIPLD